MLIYGLTGGDIAKYDKVAKMKIETVYEFLEVSLREKDLMERIK